MFAAAGLLPPAWGALVQEVIDVAVILNALRALSPDHRTRSLSEVEAATARRFMVEHRVLRPELDRLRTTADALGVMPSDEVMSSVRDVYVFLRDEIAPHEQAEDADLYPVVASHLGGLDPTSTMSRAHQEIAGSIRRLGRVIDGIDDDGPSDDQVIELRRVLYGLHAILRLHFAQEDESYLSLVDEPTEVSTSSDQDP
jgi:hypothetical protein